MLVPELSDVYLLSYGPGPVIFVLNFPILYTFKLLFQILLFVPFFSPSPRSWLGNWNFRRFSFSFWRHNDRCESIANYAANWYRVMCNNCSQDLKLTKPQTGRPLLFPPSFQKRPNMVYFYSWGEQHFVKTQKFA